jgi:DNA-binding NtrC family response regulator
MANDPSPSGRSILVVDDEPAILTFFRGLLKRDYDVADAGTAEQALELLGARRFDLLITDKNLPKLSGLELAREARKLNPASRTMLITGYPSAASAQDALELGLIDYLVKPFSDLDELRKRIADAIGAAVRPEPVASNRRVDIYEDDPVAAQRIAGALALLGLEARIQRGKIVKAGDAPRAVVVSWELASSPGPQGVWLARSLGIPFIVLTRDLTFDTAIASLRGGATGCLPKLLGDVAALSRELKRALKVADPTKG